MEGSTPEVETTATAWEGGFQPGPLREGTAQDGFQSLSHSHVKIPDSLVDIAGRTGAEDVGEFGESKARAQEGGLQLRVIHVMQYHQRLPDPRDPDLQNLFTVGKWTNGAAKKAETSTDDGDIWWQVRLRGIALTRDDQKRLAPVEVETKRGTIPLDYVQCSRETLRGTHQGAIVEVPGIQSKRGYLGLDTLDNGVESQGEPQWTQKITLLHTAATVDDILTQVEERVTGVAGFQPRRKTREAAPTLHEHGLTVDVVEGVHEVQKKGPTLIVW